MIIIGIKWNKKELNVAQRSDQRDIIQTAGRVGRVPQTPFSRNQSFIIGYQNVFERGKRKIIDQPR